MGWKRMRERTDGRIENRLYSHMDGTRGIICLHKNVVRFGMRVTRSPDHDGGDAWAPTSPIIVALPYTTTPVSSEMWLL